MDIAGSKATCESSRARGREVSEENPLDIRAFPDIVLIWLNFYNPCPARFQDAPRARAMKDAWKRGVT